MSQIYNDNTKRQKPKENQLGIFEISAKEFMPFAGNSAEGLRSTRQHYWGYVSVYENTPKKLLRISPKSCCNFAFWFKEGFGWRTVVTKLRLVSRLHGNTLSPDIYSRKPATRWVHLELCYRNPDILKKILNWIALSSATARKYTPMQDIKQPEHGRTSTTKDKK